MRFVIATIAPALTGAILAAAAARLEAAGWQFAGSALWFLAVLCAAIAVLVVILGVASLDKPQ